MFVRVVTVIVSGLEAILDEINKTETVGGQKTKVKAAVNLMLRTRLGGILLNQAAFNKSDRPVYKDVVEQANLTTSEIAKHALDSGFFLTQIKGKIEEKKKRRTRNRPFVLSLLRAAGRNTDQES